jgi:hypothetical protein
MVALPERDRWYVGLIWLAACAFGADWAGLHFMVGAFLAGAVMDADWFDQAQMDLLRHHVLLVVMPVFFLSTGCARSGTWAAPRSSWLRLAAGRGGGRQAAGAHLAGRWLGWARARPRSSAGCCRPRR